MGIEAAFAVFQKKHQNLRGLVMIFNGDYVPPEVQIDWLTGMMRGSDVQQTAKR